MLADNTEKVLNNGDLNTLPILLLNWIYFPITPILSLLVPT